MTKEKNDHVHLLSGYILYHEKNHFHSLWGRLTPFGGL
jgi:hypothetical protein